MFYREAGQFRTSYAQDSAAFPAAPGPHRHGRHAGRRPSWCMPFVANDYWLSAILIPWLILSLVALGQNILMGYAGQLSLGSAGFMAAGAFACYNLILRIDGIPFVVAVAAVRRVRRAGRHRLRPAEPAHPRPLSRGRDAGVAVLHRLGARQVRLVQELRSGGRDHRAADRHVRPQLRLARARNTWWCWSSSRCSRLRPRTWRAAAPGAAGWRCATWTSRPK